MKKRYVIIISLVLLILDTSFTPFFSIKGIYPSLLFTFAVGYSIINGKKEGVLIGILTGMLQDIFFFQGFGINALINMWICLLAGFVGGGIWREKKVIPLISVFVASILKYIGMYLIMSVFDIKIDIIDGIYYGLYNSVIMILIYGKLYRACSNNEKEFSWRFKEK